MTNYPWDRTIRIEVQDEGEFSLFLRIPGWAGEGVGIAVNGDSQTMDPSSAAYAEIHRSWAAGDSVVLSLPMPVQKLESHPHVFENTGRVAVMRGPILYCLEEAGNDGLDRATFSLSSEASPGTAATSAARTPIVNSR